MLDKVMNAGRTPSSSNKYDKVLVAGQIQDWNLKNGIYVSDNVADRLFCETADSVAAYFEQDPGGIDYTATRAIVNPHSVTSTYLWNPSSILWNSTDTIAING